MTYKEEKRGEGRRCIHATMNKAWEIKVIPRLSTVEFYHHVRTFDCFLSACTGLFTWLHWAQQAGHRIRVFGTILSGTFSLVKDLCSDSSRIESFKASAAITSLLFKRCFYMHSGRLCKTTQDSTTCWILCGTTSSLKKKKTVCKHTHSKSSARRCWLGQRRRMI